MDKKNKPTKHSPPKMKPYGYSDWYDPKFADKGITRMTIKENLRELLEEYEY
jgi:hypothetical protein